MAPNIYKSKVSKVSKNTKMPKKSNAKSPRELRMQVQGHVDATSTSSKVHAVLSDVASRTESFDSLLDKLNRIEANKREEEKGMIISRGAMGEGEITFTVDRGKKKKRSDKAGDSSSGKHDDNEDEKGGDEFTHKERDNGRKKQRFAGRRSASNNVIRRLG
ncbi:uncharacterized protein V1518DRAFT_415212 [Limtongia smithiae]|uniref:uncharacterized protein n=1 Tax=Limtongia smithiae TaxID=1125753 RepID=UPI0034CF8293